MSSVVVIELGQVSTKAAPISVQEKRERAKAALKVNESIAKERSSLVRQLDELREENKVLKVCKDPGTQEFAKHLTCDRIRRTCKIMQETPIQLPSFLPRFLQDVLPRFLKGVSPRF